jgi:DNA replication and repair protein RecF
LRFNQIAVRGVRNLRAAEYRFSKSVNILIGGNGQGKTSVLEALCIAATGRSFRTEQLREVLQSGQDTLVITATIEQDELCRQQKLVLSGHNRQGFINGTRIPRLAEYATHTPLVVFHPNDLELVTGAAATRRNLLARIALYSDPATQENRVAYTRALRHRQVLLDKTLSDHKALTAFESILANHGQQLARSNALAAAQLCRELTDVFANLSSNALTLETRFIGVETPEQEAYRRQLFEMRGADRRRGRATFGPHRDEIQLMLAGQSARHHASQGQQRLLALAIKLAELRCIQSVRRVHPVLILDDVVSELDSQRTRSFFDWLQSTDSQIFITAPRDDVLSSSTFADKEPRIFVVDNGELQGPL